MRWSAQPIFGVRRLDLIISIKCCAAHRARAACFIANSPEQGRDASPRRPCSMPDRHGILGGIFHPNGLRGGGFGETALPIAACAVNELYFIRAQSEFCACSKSGGRTAITRLTTNTNLASRSASGIVNHVSGVLWECRASPPDIEQVLSFFSSITHALGTRAATRVATLL